MLIKFRFSNFLSFKDEVEFDIRAGNIKGFENNLIKEKVDLLKSIAILGANGSGKSNLIKAIAKFQAIIRNSINLELQRQYPHESFLLDKIYHNKNSFFEIEFILDDLVYTYGFEIEKNGNINKEYLYEQEIRKRVLFERDNQNIKINNRFFNEAKNLVQHTRENSLFLSITAQFNVKKSKKIYDYLINNIVVFLDLDCNKTKFHAIGGALLKDEYIKKEALKFLKLLDFNIQDLEVKKEKLPTDIIEKIKNDSSLPETLKKDIEDGLEDIFIQRYLFDDKKIKDFISFPLNSESEGTQKLVFLIPHLIDVIKNNKIVFIDELDNSLHTILIKKVIELFQIFSKKSQLFFTTHDLCILEKPYIFRRDQIYFLEKDRKFGNTKLYSLYDFKIRNDKDILKNLLNGEFGAIPIIDDLMDLE